jgi:hypothetical protein
MLRIGQRPWIPDFCQCRRPASDSVVAILASAGPERRLPPKNSSRMASAADLKSTAQSSQLSRSQAVGHKPHASFVDGLSATPD